MMLRTSEPERSCVQLVPYLLTGPVIERILKLAFEAKDQFVAYNAFAVISRIFWTSLPTEKFGLGGEDNELHTEGLDDRDRRVMGTFKETAKTAAVREVLMNHIADFNAMMEREMKNEGTIIGPDAMERRICPQSMMMLAELFHHFFEYSEDALFLKAVEEGLITHLLDMMLAFPYNTYLHSHVLDSITEQLSRKQKTVTDAILTKTNLLAQMSEGVQMVRLVLSTDG